VEILTVLLRLRFKPPAIIKNPGLSNIQFEINIPEKLRSLENGKEIIVSNGKERVVKSNRNPLN
jgi:hypothetical protein